MQNRLGHLPVPAIPHFPLAAGSPVTWPHRVGLAVRPFKRGHRFQGENNYFRPASSKFGPAVFADAMRGGPLPGGPPGPSFGAIYGTMVVPSISRNLRIHSEWAGQAGPVTRLPLTWALENVALGST
jgi:hypothetical protein